MIERKGPKRKREVWIRGERQRQKQTGTISRELTVTRNIADGAKTQTQFSKKINDAKDRLIMRYLQIGSI